MFFLKTAEKLMIWGCALSAEIIDSHIHVMFPVEEQIGFLKEAGVDRAVLFPTIVHPEKAENRNGFKKEIEVLNRVLRGETNPLEARIASIGELLSVIEGHSGIFYGFGSVPAGQDYDYTSGWIEKHIVDNNLAGVGEVSFGAGEAWKTENIFKALSDYDKSLPLWIHTFNPLTLDDIRTIVELSDKYKGVKTILGHGGGSYWLETIEMIRDKPDIYFDISALFSVLPLKYSASEFPERVLFSSDMPYGNTFLARQNVEYIIKDKAVRSLILGGNILNLLK